MLNISQMAAALSGISCALLGIQGLLNSVIEAHLLLVGTSAQKAELVALTWALQLAAGVQVNIYTDSKYAFTAIHVHVALYKERGLIDSGGKSIKYEQEILELIDTLWAPKQVAVIHSKGTRRERQ
jgi:ribonuclease HI